jgi:hypothetical protein
MNLRAGPVQSFPLLIGLLCACHPTKPSVEELARAGDLDLQRPHGKEFENAFFERAQSGTPNGVVVAGCPDLSQPFTLIFVVDSKGRISEAYASPETEESKCLAAAFRRVQYPAPPFAPFRIVTTW